MTTFYIIRHGQSMGNLQKVFWGQMDGPLTETGKKQAQITADYLRDVHFDAAVASDLMRAYDTGAIIAAPHGLTVKPEKGLREINAGVWEGVPFADLPVRYPEDFSLWMSDIASSRPTGGESVRELADRIEATMWRLAEEYEGKTVLLASHATPIRTQICRWKNEPLSKMQTIGWVPNASVTFVDYDTARH